jgi:hypothetical protein
MSGPRTALGPPAPSTAAGGWLFSPKARATTAAKMLPLQDPAEIRQKSDTRGTLRSICEYCDEKRLQGASGHTPKLKAIKKYLACLRPERRDTPRTTSTSVKRGRETARFFPEFGRLPKARSRKGSGP